MKYKIKIKMFKPFGSTLSAQTLPDDLVKDFLADLKMIRALPDKERQEYMFGHKLVGSVENEYLVTSRVLLKYTQSFFDVCVAEYCQAVYPHSIKVKKIIINSAWYVVQKINQFNSIHQHTNHTQLEQPHPSISCIGYLQIPKMIPLKFSKAHHDISGSVEFFEGSENYFVASSWRKDPVEKMYLVFPSHLAHWAYPFNSEDKDAERISFSFNARVEFMRVNVKEKL